MKRSIVRFALPILALTLLPACADSPQALFAKAQESFSKEDYDTARIQVASALQDDPNNPAMLELLARSYMRLGDADGAEGAIHRLEEAGGSSEGLAVLKAEIALSRGYPKRALERLGAAHTVDAWRVRAEANLALDRRNDAVEAFEKGMAAGGGIRLAEAYARFRLNANELGKAGEVYERMVALDPKAYETLVLAGDLAAARGETEKAIVAFDKVVAAFPDRMAPRIALANQYDIAGKIDKAMEVVDAARKVGGNPPALEEMKIQLLSEKGDWKAIRDSLQGRESQLAPGSALSLSYGEALLHLGHAEQGRLIFKRATLALPGNPYARLMLGIAELQTGDSSGAWATLRPLAMSPLARPEAIDAARQAAAAVGAPEASELAARLDPVRLKASQERVEAGTNAMARRDWDAAVRIYSPLLAPGDDVEVLKRLAVATAHLGRADQALDYADRALALEPANPDCLYVAGFVRLQSGSHIAEARRLLQAAAKADPNNAIIAQALLKAKAAEG